MKKLLIYKTLFNWFMNSVNSLTGFRKLENFQFLNTLEIVSYSVESDYECET